MFVKRRRLQRNCTILCIFFLKSLFFHLQKVLGQNDRLQQYSLHKIYEMNMSGLMEGGGSVAVALGVGDR